MVDAATCPSFRDVATCPDLSAKFDIESAPRKSRRGDDKETKSSSTVEQSVKHDSNLPTLCTVDTVVSAPQPPLTVGCIATPEHTSIESTRDPIPQITKNMAEINKDGEVKPPAELINIVNQSEVAAINVLLVESAVVSHVPHSVLESEPLPGVVMPTVRRTESDSHQSVVTETTVQAAHMEHDKAHKLSTDDQGLVASASMSTLTADEESNFKHPSTLEDVCVVSVLCSECLHNGS